VEEDGPGNQTVSQGSGGESPRGKTQGSSGRSFQDLEVLRPGNEALKRTRSGRVERHQGTAGGQGPGNRHPSGRGQTPKGESRERCGGASRPSARRDREQTVKWVIKPRRRSEAEPTGTAPKAVAGGRAEDRSRRMCCGDEKPRESHRGLR
jgi:hypothetical protein